MLQAFKAVPKHSGNWPGMCMQMQMEFWKILGTKLFDQYGFTCIMWPADSFVLWYGHTLFEVSCTLSGSVDSAS